MATLNNVTKDWNAVIASAQQQLVQIAARRQQLIASTAKFQPAVNAAKQKNDAAIAAVNAAIAIRLVPNFEQVLAAKKALAANPTNPQLRTEYERLQKEFQASQSIRNTAIANAEATAKATGAEYRRALSAFDAEAEQAIALEDQRVQLESDIAFARQQLSAQKTGTTPVNTTTVSATTVPAAARPGNAAVATTTSPISITNLTPIDVPTITTPTTPNQLLGAEAIVINANPFVVPVIDVTTGEVIGSNIIQPGPIVIPADDASITTSRGDVIATAPLTITEPGPISPIEIPTIEAGPPAMGLSSAIKNASGAATAQDQANFESREDWRVRLALAPGSTYLYNAPNPGILSPLSAKGGTNGVIFPYTPQINVTYAAIYQATDLTHTNYRIQQYQSSSVDNVSITCEFTAQDVREARYVLAVIHFFRSMTKMFYGQDSEPKNGTPPPLCYIYGMGGYQFDALPLAISGFTYSLPQDVDYIKATGASAAGTPQPSVQNAATGNGKLGTGIGRGGKPLPPSYGSTPTSAGENTTWVPTKIQLAITCVPIMSRNQVSNNFSLTEYATGNLLNGTRQQSTGGGFW